MSALLLRTKKFYLFIFKHKEEAVSFHGRASATTSKDAVAWWRTRFSNELKCFVTFSKPNDIFLVLEECKAENLLKVLHGEQVGWIHSFRWIGLKEVKEEEEE